MPRSSQRGTRRASGCSGWRSRSRAAAIGRRARRGVPRRSPGGSGERAVAIATVLVDDRTRTGSTSASASGARRSATSSPLPGVRLLAFLRPLRLRCRDGGAVRIRPGATCAVRPAATVVVMRPGPDGAEVLLTQRPATMAFGPGLHVFPGGAVDPGDCRSAACSHASAATSGRRARDSHAGAFMVAAIRELFEETGVLLATPRRRAAPRSTRRRSTVGAGLTFLEASSAARPRAARGLAGADVALGDAAGR